MSPRNFNAAMTASVMGIIEGAPWRTSLSPMRPASELIASFSEALKAERVTSPSATVATYGSNPSLALISSLDDQEENEVSPWPKSLSVKNTFIHVERQDVEEDDELAMPIRSKSAPSIKSAESTSSVLLYGNSFGMWEASPMSDTGRTPKVTFNLSPQFFAHNASEYPNDPEEDLIEVPCASPASSRVSSISHATPHFGDVLHYEVKNTFIQFDKSQAEDYEDDDLTLPMKSVSNPSLPTSSFARSPMACPARVCLESLSCSGTPTASPSKRATFKCSPSIPGTPLKLMAEAPVASFFPESEAADNAAGLVLCASPGLASVSSMDQWASPTSYFDAGGESRGSNRFRVKNTFVHVDKDVDADDGIGFCLPTKSVSQPDLGREEQESPSFALAPSIPEVPVVPPALPSVGAALHASGQCKPCAWFWKPESCQWGLECGHCHLCPEGEIRRRKKEKQSEMKSARAAAAALIAETNA
jgi:hypothetical protein